jgi:hypothetical protein
VGLKHFENSARREWWAIHIEAWQRSGLSQARYCKQHRLTRQVFARWLRVVSDGKALEHQPHLKRSQGDSKLCKSKRSIAVQAFWAMHVEALNWSGLTVTHYAAALKMSAHSLRRWRDLFEAEEVSIDWRARLHPSALPKISTSASSAAKEPGIEKALTDSPIVDPPNRDRANRRRFSNEENWRSCVTPTALTPALPRSAGAMASSPACCSGGGYSSDSASERRSDWRPSR